MHNTSSTWQDMWGNPLHEEELRVDIAGVQYDHANIISVKTSGGIFTQLDIGNCAARQIDLEIVPQETIPRQAEIRVYVRLKVGEQVSEWLPKGVYFISTRETNKVSGTMVIHGFDAMLKANAVWINEDFETVDWPWYETKAVEDIADRMGVEIDPRTHLDNEFPVEYPVDENGDLMMVDILEGIAIANVGNWVISDEGKLLLLRLGDMPEDTNYLVTQTGDTIMLGDVRILVG